MHIRLSDLWRWDGTVDRGPYALIGVVGFAIKHNMDRAVATLLFHRRWELFNYWIPPTKAIRFASLPHSDAVFLMTMLAMALPFIWVGVVLTLRRLRAVGLPAWLVAFFFLPVINLLFFLILSIVPSRPLRRPEDSVLPRKFQGRPKAVLDRVIPENPVGSAAMAILLTVPLGLAATRLGTGAFARYGWGLFVALPFCLGLGAVLLHGYHRPRSFGSCLAVSCLSALLLGVGLVLVAVEGVICLMMALPIGLPLAAMGGSVGFLIQRRPWIMNQARSMMVALVLFVPGLMETENMSRPSPPLFAVSTRLEVDAPPEKVWREVVSFAELPEPREWLFRLGVAYPVRARIHGRGVGAVRHCIFSTGAFEEPIEVWDEPRLLKFSVTANPAPMRERTPYSEIHPPHLSGSFLSREGQFRLTSLPGGRTSIEGTTWYEHNMWPAIYWRFWSDAIIHKIHRRVLIHIKQLAEQHRAPSASH